MTVTLATAEPDDGNILATHYLHLVPPGLIRLAFTGN